VPLALSRVVMRTLARNRDERPATAAQLHDELVHAGESHLAGVG
jgi:hypothetical protein